LNSVGLQRNGFPEEVVRELKKAYRLFFRSEMNLSQAMAAAEQELQMYPEVSELMRFVEASGRGVVI
jgi:UDP-N-acetylglucosamine acyltransferase